MAGTRLGTTTNTGAVGAALLALAGFALGCGGSESPQTDGSRSLPNTPSGGASAVDPYTFDSLAQGVATSDLVVEGTVVAVEPGGYLDGGNGSEERDADKSEPVAGESSETASGAIELQRVTVSVDQPFWPAGKAPEVVTVIEGGSYAPSSTVGDRGVYLLTRYPGFDGAFGRINSQSTFLAASDGTVTPSDPEASWATAATDDGYEAFLGRVEEAVEEVEGGKVEPARPLFGQGSP